MRRALLLALLPATLLTGVGSARAAVPTTRHFEIEGRQAIADFLGGSGCVRTFVEVRAMDGRISTDRRVVGSELMVFLIEHNICVHTILTSAVATVPLARPAFQIDRRLTSASLDTTCLAFDFVSSRLIPISVSLRWGPAGPRDRVRHHVKLHALNFVVLEDSRLSSRPATATGSVVVGARTFAAGTADRAEMDKVLASAVTIRY
jgi:hypothetical protein